MFWKEMLAIRNTPPLSYGYSPCSVVTYISWTVRDFLPRLPNFIKEEFLTPETRQGILHDKS